jgi:uncharacterized membrane protein
MSGARELRQLDDTHLNWCAEVWGKDKEWDAKITGQDPDRRVSWRSVGGTTNAGTVRLEPLGENRTRVRLALSDEPEGVATWGKCILSLERRMDILWRHGFHPTQDGIMETA